MDKWCRLAGIARYTPHALRHTKAQRIMHDSRYGTPLYEPAAPAQVAQLHLGLPPAKQGDAAGGGNIDGLRE
jgi:integrase